MLILLPPSEGKAVVRRGKPVDLNRLSFPDLAAGRAQIMAALLTLCSTEVLVKEPNLAAQVLGLGPTQRDQIDLNRGLRTSPAVRADRLYTGVLYDALDFSSLPTGARQRAARSVVITSSLFGLVRPTDALPFYRLSGGTRIPGFGTVAKHWRSHLPAAIEPAVGKGILLDLRSSTYAALWKPPPPLAARCITVRVLHEAQGKRTIVSHFNKATKGRIVRSLLLDGATPGSVDETEAALKAIGWTVERPEPNAFDIIVTQV